MKGTNRRWWKQDLASVSTLVSSFVQSFFLAFLLWVPLGVTVERLCWASTIAPRAPWIQAQSHTPSLLPQLSLLLNEAQGLLEALHFQEGSDRASFWSMLPVNGTLHTGQPWGTVMGTWPNINHTVNIYWAIYLCQTLAISSYTRITSFYPHSNLKRLKKKKKKRITTPVPFYRWKNRGPERLSNLPDVTLLSKKQNESWLTPKALTFILSLYYFFLKCQEALC